jgi:3-oxoadipate enol-lactonase
MNVNTLYVKTQGSFSNRALVLLHAFPLTSEMWNTQMKYFSESYYTLAPDLPGFGKGTLPDHAFTFEHYVDMVYNFLKETGLKKSVWCGLSMGGYLALRLYEKAPELCSGLILCNTKSDADDNATKLKRWATIKNLHFHQPEFIEQQWRALVGESSQKKMELKKDLELMITENSEEAICSGLVAMASRTDTTEMLSKIKVPTLILAGAEDQVIPVSEVEKMAKAIPGSKLVILKKTGHLSNLENSEEFNAAVTEFLASL